MNIKWKYKNVLRGVLLAILTASIVITSFYSQYNVNPTEQFVWEPDYPSAGSSCLFEISNNVETPFGTYSPNMLNYTPSIPMIELPEDLYEIENYYRIASEVSNESLDFFNEYGFVTTYGYANDIYAYYDVEKNAWGEMYVTTDLCLHTFHTLYDVYLRILEGEHFYNDLEIMLKTLREDQFIRNSSFTDVNVINAMNKNVAYLSTMLKLLNDSNTIPIEVQSMVESELTKINTSIPAYSSIFGYDEDYSQYKVRGHYTRNEILSRYFQAMMYAGRMGFLVQNPSLSTEMAIEQTRMAMLLISSFNATVESETVWNLWENITKPISFFVGVSDDLTAYDYYEVWENFGTPDGNSLANDTLIELMIEDLKAYPSPRINSMILGALENPQSYIRGFRLMGQSFIPDSYIFQQLVEPNILSRTIPTALDIFSVFGSPRAEHYLQSVNETYPEYSETVMNLREEFGDFNEEDWTTNLYSLWIYSLFPLLQPVDMGYPQYMLNDSWTDKALMTASGSWTELRHDSILYSKASMTFLSLDDGLGYIEAYPEVYSRLSSLVELMINGLEGMGLLNTDFSDRLNYLQAIFTRLANVSIKLLENQVINSSDRYFIKIVGGELEDLAKFLNPEYQQWISTTDQRMAIVADVHTDPSSSQVLEVATGNPYVIYVLVQDHNGNYRVAKGATYSFYEFLQPMTERLTDEEWHVILYSNPPDPPFWIQYSLQIVIPEIHPRTVTLAVLTINLPKQKVANLNFKIGFNK